MALRLNHTLGQTLAAIGLDLRKTGAMIDALAPDIAQLGAAPRTALRNRLKVRLGALVTELTGLEADIDAL